MRQPRRKKKAAAKKRRIELIGGNSNDDDDDKKEEEVLPPLRAARAQNPDYCDDNNNDLAVDDDNASLPLSKKQRMAEEARCQTQTDYNRIWTEDEVAANLAFCCARCSCTRPEKEAILGTSSNKLDEITFTVHENSPFHRRCCHKVTQNDVTADLLLDAHAAVEQGMLEEQAQMDQSGPQEEQQEQAPPLLTAAAVAQHRHRAKTQQAEIHNEDEMEEQSTRLLTSKAYVANAARFDKAPHKNKPAAAATVLDLFGGIGSALVVLKRLGIAMQTVIHVEHDPIASFVARVNHDPRLTAQLQAQDAIVRQMEATSVDWNGPALEQEDAISHVYYEKFEEIERDVEAFCNRHPGRCSGLYVCRANTEKYLLSLFSCCIPTWHSHINKKQQTSTF